MKEKEAQDFNEYKEVVKALQPYIESAKTGDGKVIRSAFYDHAHIVGSMEGTFLNYTADEFGAAVSASEHQKMFSITLLGLIFLDLPQLQK